ncbi:MAG TPA: phosphatidylglycerol lysyltransferase domain-containing protein, partial [Planctomycetaceae bacterium]|nr:phosphatidylglycerol lysyltransferase domain-containing protein [Planctomycetaceae bacterium]
WALFPPTAPLSYGELMGVFMLAQTAGLVSNVPGGLGVFETVMLVTLQSKFPAPEILGTLMAYRTIYYLGPFVLALVMLAGHEIFERREHIVRVARYVKPWVPGLVPQVLAFTTFVGGAILLYSGALPADRHRFWFLRALPLPVIELSHFLGSVIGAVLLILARGLQRRLDAAYYCACLLLGLGIVTAVLKGFDYEEAIALGLMLIALLPCHQHFYRKSALLQEPFTPSWIAAMILVFVGMLWLGMFTYKHVEYTDQLWWNFSLHSHDQAGDASRFLRASVGAICAMLVFAIAYLARPATPEPNLPGPEDLDRAWEVVRKSPATYANLALLGDKTLLFSESGKSFLMYAIERRSWVALGDPVGDPADRTELLWRFREMCDHHEGWPVFYQVQPTNLPLYIDLGLALLKLGEEARVALPTFTLEGNAHKGLRHGYNRGLQAGLTFEIAPVEQVPALMPRLRQVSDAWLGEKHTREKRFSLGFFDEDYLRRFPMALIRRDDQIIGFANMWCGADKEE